MTKDVLVRQATPDDFDQLLNLFDEVAAERLWIGTEPGFDRSAYRFMLLTHAIDWARERQEPALSLLVFPHNSAAIALYKRFGFEERRRHEGFKKRQSGEVWDVILMVLPL